MDQLKEAMRDLSQVWGRRISACDEILKEPITKETRERVKTKRGMLVSMKQELRAEVNRVLIQKSI